MRESSGCIGVLPEFDRVRRSLSKTEENRMSVHVELQADCFAGIWAHHTQHKGLLEKGDIEEAINAAHQIGDDTLQLRAQGYMVPESFNHGTSEQRNDGSRAASRAATRPIATRSTAKSDGYSASASSPRRSRMRLMKRRKR